MKRGIGFVLCLIGFAAVMFAGVLGVVENVGTDDGLYYRLQMSADVLDRAGISAEDLVRVDRALAECLEGDADALVGLEATVFGEVQPAFNEKERIHMEDCRKLFELLRAVMWTGRVLGLAAVAGGIVLLRDGRRVRLASWLAPLVIVVPLGAFALWAVCDFNAAFNFFHEVLFTNDLWLLDFRTDLLIRICPTSMFMNMGARIAISGLIWVLAVPLLVTAAVRAIKERG